MTFFSTGLCLVCFFGIAKEQMIFWKKKKKRKEDIKIFLKVKRCWFVGFLAALLTNFLVLKY